MTLESRPLSKGRHHPAGIVMRKVKGNNGSIQVLPLVGDFRQLLVDQLNVEKTFIYRGIKFGGVFIAEIGGQAVALFLTHRLVGGIKFAERLIIIRPANLLYGLQLRFSFGAFGHLSLPVEHFHDVDLESQVFRKS